MRFHLDQLTSQTSWLRATGTCVVVATLAVLSPATMCWSDVAVITASVDGDIESDGTIDDSSIFSQTQQGGGGVDTRNIFEFDLSSIPAGAIITSVEFSGHTTLNAGNGTLNLSDYVGTGPPQISVADYSVAGNLVATVTGGIDFFSTHDFAFMLSDISNAQLAADTTEIIGLRGDMTSFGDTWRVASLEQTTRKLPTLTVNYARIPEPSAACVLLLGLCTTGLHRRRSKSP
ncbi:MAG: hypothetical protein AAF456_16555 [Planctomycetota bacterium]